LGLLKHQIKSVVLRERNKFRVTKGDFFRNLVSTKFKFSYDFKSMSSRNTVLFFKKLESVYPYEEGIKIVREIMSLNFLKRFDKYLKEKGIEHNYIYDVHL